MKLHRFIPALLAAVALSACADLNTAVTFTTTDLMNADAIDQTQIATMNPNLAGPAQVDLQCNQWFLANAALIQGQLANAPPVTGFFSFQSAALAFANNFMNSLSPAQQAAFELACGPKIAFIESLPVAFASLGIVK